MGAERLPAEQVGVRAGAHETFKRIVFEWPDVVGYRITRHGDEVAIEFDRPGRFDLSPIAEEVGPLVVGARAEGDDVSQRVVLGVRPDAAYRWFDLGNRRVAIDVFEMLPIPTAKPADLVIGASTDAGEMLIDVTPQGVDIVTTEIGSRFAGIDERGGGLVSRQSEIAQLTDDRGAIDGPARTRLRIGDRLLSPGESALDIDFSDLGLEQGAPIPPFPRETAFEVGNSLIRLAQATIDPSTEADAAAASAYDAAHQAMMADPTDTEKAYEFAEAAVAVGDLYGAISALEQILLLDPNSPDIRLRLGQLYQRVGAIELAQMHLGEGITSRDIPEPIRRQAEVLLESARAEQALAVSPHRFFGSINVGGRYETNANAGPGSNKIRVFGFEGPFLSDEDKEEDDFSALGITDLSYWYDFGTQAGHRIESDLLLVGTRYNDVSKVNALLSEAELGPRIFLGKFLRDAGTKFMSLRPFATGSYLSLDDDTYRKTYGFGLNTRTLLNSTMVLDTTARALRQDFDDTTKEPTASNQTGDYFTYRPSIIWSAGPETLITVAGLLGYNNADEGFETFRELGGVAGITHFFEPPFPWIADRAWSASLAGAYRNTDYDKADPTIDPDQKQNDDRFDLNLDAQIPLVGDGFSLNLGAQQTWNESNLPNEEFDNTAVTMTIRYAF